MKKTEDRIPKPRSERRKDTKRKYEHKIGNGSGKRETERDREKEGKIEGRKIWTEKKKKKTP